MVEPTFSKGLKSPITVGRCEIDTEDGAKLPVKIGKTALGPLHDAYGNPLKRAQTVGDELKDLGFSKTRLRANHGEAAFHDEVFHSEEERFEGGRYPEGFGGNIGYKRIPFESKESQELFIMRHGSRPP
jgi:hypothetical protein